MVHRLPDLGSRADAHSGSRADAPTLTSMALSRRLTAALGAALTTMMADTALAFQPHVVFVMLDDWGYNVRIALNRTHRRVQRRVSGCHNPSRSRR